MAKYSYPAILTPEETGGYSVVFPDINGCFTCGDNLIDSLEMARDALALMLYEYEETGKIFPVPTEIKKVNVKNNEFANLVVCDTLEYRKKHNNKAVKKTLTIPEWLNEAACAMNINFSQVLQEALLQKLNL